MCKYLVCAHREWGQRVFRRLDTCYYDGTLITRREELTPEYVQSLKPDLILFLDWSWLVSEDIWSKYQCVQFHSAPLPEFRGGSPLQNQIERGIKHTKLTAFKMDGGIDTGDILLQRELDLTGHLSDIFARLEGLCFDMTTELLAGRYTQTPQQGIGSYYPRRKPAQSELKLDELTLEQVYDRIRMLEDPYPNAFIRVGSKWLVFKTAEYQAGKIAATVELIEEPHES